MSVLFLTLVAATLPLRAAEKTAPVARSAKETTIAVEASPEFKAMMKKIEDSWEEADSDSKKWSTKILELEAEKGKRDKELNDEYARQAKRRAEMDEQTFKQMQAYYAREDEFFKKRTALLDAQTVQLNTLKAQSDKLDALLAKWDTQTRSYSDLLKMSDRLGEILQKWEQQQKRYDELLTKKETAP